MWITLGPVENEIEKKPQVSPTNASGTPELQKFARTRVYLGYKRKADYSLALGRARLRFYARAQLALGRAETPLLVMTTNRAAEAGGFPH